MLMTEAYAPGALATAVAASSALLEPETDSFSERVRALALMPADG